MTKKILRQVLKEVDTRSEFQEKVVEISRISRTVAGGRRIRFRALVVIGDRRGRVGLGVAKASEVAEAVKKAVRRAKKRIITFPINDLGTIPHQIVEDLGAAKVLLKPARPGTGIIAGGAIRIVLELSGIKNIVSKMLGDHNKINNAKATLNALKNLSEK